MLSARVARIIELALGCGLMLASLLAFRIHRIRTDAADYGVDPDVIARSCNTKTAVVQSGPVTGSPYSAGR